MGHGLKCRPNPCVADQQKRIRNYRRFHYFDAAAHPIIAKHFFAIEAPRPIGQVTVGVVADPRFRRQVNGQEAA